MADLVVRDLVVEFDSGPYKVRPLDELSFTVPDGSLAVLLGPSGCGKTTLLSCLGGILTPTSGSITYGDLAISGLTPSQLTEYRQKDVGIVFQAFNLLPSLTATENVMAPLVAAGVGRSKSRARALELLERVGLSDRVNHLPGQLSGGQQQRVSLARALVHDAPLLIADEPTASLDYIQVETVLRLLRELAQEGRVIVVATHDDRLIPLADEIIEMVPAFHDEATPEVRAELVDGENLFRQGDRGNRIFVINEGAVEIIREYSDGHEEHLATLDTGEYFGEMAPLFGIERSATARAKGATKLTGYTTERFREVFGIDRLADLVRANPPEFDQ